MDPIWRYGGNGVQPLDAYRGRDQFGPAYAYMYEHDVYGEGSVDRVILDNMVLLCAETAPCLSRPPEPSRIDYRRGSRRGLEAILADMPYGAGADWAVVRAVAGVCAVMVHAADAMDVPLEAMRFGGTEEEIAARGSNWCTDVARLACRLCQVAGLPARIVTLADTRAAYSGHQIIEVWWGDAWGGQSIQRPGSCIRTPTAVPRAPGI